MNEQLIVYLVEDNDELRNATLTVLIKHGFDATGMACAEDLDESHARRAPDLYVIDLNLPGEDGLSLAVRLRKSQPYAGIVMTTGRSEVSHRIQGYAAGADIYMPKPVDPLELVAALHTLGMRRRNLKSDGHLLKLDSRLLTLRGANGQCRLAESEARLLMSLSTAKENMLERWQVAHQLSPDNDGISPDNLQNRLSQLRKKIQSCGIEGETIKSIRTLGYRLCIDIEII